MYPKLICGLLVCTISCVLGAEILAVLPLPARSHFIYTQSVLSALAYGGHHVTIYSPFAPTQSHFNMKYVVVKSSNEEILKGLQTFDAIQELGGDVSYFGLGSRLVWELSYDICKNFFNHTKVKQLLVSDQKFDLVVAESLFGEESMLVFGHVFNASIINLHSFTPTSIVNKIHGNDLQITHFPDVVSFPYSDQMSFLERLKNSISTFGTLLFYYFDHLPKHDRIIKEAFNDSSLSPVANMISKISLTLANFHPYVSYPQAYTSNIVPVGGIHLFPESPLLSRTIQRFMDGDKGVIYFSLGTVVPEHLMPKHYIQIFTDVFKELPYKVLWRTVSDNVPNLPSNVIISKWVPQQSVLEHQNCVLFITHGGLLSQHEVFHAGVPVVVIPFFGDQPFNARLYEKLGTGIKLDFQSLTRQSLSKTIAKVLKRKRYMKNAKKVSAIFKDRPVSPAASVVFSVNNVLEHGDERLRPQAAALPWYQLTTLDILAISLLAVTSVVIAAVSMVIIPVVIFRKVLNLLWLCGPTNTADESDTEIIIVEKKDN